MRDPSAVTEQFLTNQVNFFRLAAKAGFSQKIISMDTGYSITTVNQWALGKCCMGGPALLAVNSIKDIDAELLSVLLDGTSRHIVDGEDEDSALDDLGDVADEVASEVRRARHPHSPGGTDIVEIEEARIKRAAQTLRRKARAA